MLIASHPAIVPESIPNCIDFTPEIVLVSSKRLIGCSFRMSITHNQSIAMWDQLNAQLSMLAEIPQTSLRYSIYEMQEECQQSRFHESSEATAFIGVDWGEQTAPDGLVEKNFAGGKYAKFIHKGSVETLLSTYQYIWGVWFPQSGYELADREDFECYTDKFLGPFHINSEIEIYFPIL